MDDEISDKDKFSTPPWYGMRRETRSYNELQAINEFNHLTTYGHRLGLQIIAIPAMIVIKDHTDKMVFQSSSLDLIEAFLIGLDYQKNYVEG